MQSNFPLIQSIDLLYRSYHYFPDEDSALVFFTNKSLYYLITELLLLFNSTMKLYDNYKNKRKLEVIVRILLIAMYHFLYERDHERFDRGAEGGINDF